MKLFSLLPKRLVHLACNSPKKLTIGNIFYQAPPLWLSRFWFETPPHMPVDSWNSWLAVQAAAHG